MHFFFVLPYLLRYLFITVNNLFSKSQVVLGTGGIRIIKNSRDTVAGSLAQFHISLNYGVEHQFLEVAFLLHRRFGLPGAGVNRTSSAGTFDFQCRIQFRLDNLDCVQQFADPSRAKYSACTGIITESAAVRALIVISPNEGEQSIRI